MTTTNRRPRASALVPLLLLVACTPAPEEIPPIELPPVCEAGDGAVEAGVTGVSACVDGRCPFGGAACSVDADCYAPLIDGDTLPAWTRPQGGIGTSYNVRVAGLVDDEQYETLRSLFTLERTSVACDVDACANGDCPCDAARKESCLDLPEGSRCAIVLSDQLNRRFPRRCRGDNAIHVEEIPILFRIEFPLADLDGEAVELEVHLGYGGEVYRAELLSLVLEETEFQNPASFDPLDDDRG